jgi:carnitine O-acetyltransferase
MYTITSRKEMPNEEYIKEVAKAAEDLFQLHAEGDEKVTAKL